MSASEVDQLAAVRAHLGAATSAPEPTAGVHLARARLLYEHALAELRSIEIVLLAREREWAARSSPPATAPAQTTLPVETTGTTTPTGTTTRRPRHHEVRGTDALPDIFFGRGEGGSK
jgi:hypothetical protein